MNLCQLSRRWGEIILAVLSLALAVTDLLKKDPATAPDGRDSGEDWGFFAPNETNGVRRGQVPKPMR